MKQTLMSWLQTLDTDFFNARVQVLVPWWDRFLNVNGTFVEVCHVPSATQCHVDIKVRINFSALECLPYFCKFSYKFKLSMNLHALRTEN
jgi:hypothetical protein